MADEIFVRVELHEHPDRSKPDYEVLKAYLARQLFSHELREGSRWVSLPTGMYVSTVPMTLDEAVRRVQQAADATGFANCGLITSTQGRRHFGLKARTLMPASSRFSRPLAPLAPAKDPAPVPTIGALLADAMKRAKP